MKVLHLKIATVAFINPLLDTLPIALNNDIFHSILKLNGLVAFGSLLGGLNQLKVLNLDSATIVFILASTSGSVLRDISFDCIHPMFVNAAWTNIIQTSLVLGLWAGKKWDLTINNRKNSIEDSTNSKIRRNKSSLQKYYPMIVAFLIGALSSMIGGFMAYQIMIKYFPTNDIFEMVTLISAVCASYIGGTMNFFETARVLIGDTNSRIIQLAVGVDTGVMIMYFWFLNAIRKSRFMLSLFNNKAKEKGKLTANLSDNTSLTDNGFTSQTDLPTTVKFNGSKPSLPINTNPPMTDLMTSKQQQSYSLTNIVKYFMISISALTITMMANTVEKLTPLSGISVLFSTIFALGFLELLQFKERKTVQKYKEMNNNSVVIQPQPVDSATFNSTIFLKKINQYSSGKFLYL